MICPTLYVQACLLGLKCNCDAGTLPGLSAGINVQIGSMDVTVIVNGRSIYTVYTSITRTQTNVNF